MARSPVQATKEVNVTPDFDEDNLKAIAEVYLQEGNKEYKEKNFSDAIHFYTEGIKVNCKDNVKNAKLYSNRATAQFKLGNYQETLNDAKAVIKLEPTFIKAIERGASACIELQLYEDAITWCDKGLTIDKNNRTLLDLRSRSVIEELSKLKGADQEKVTSTAEGEKATLSQFPSFMARSPIKAAKQSDVTPRVEETSDFDVETLRAKAELYKNEGNDEYRSNKFSNAEKLYTKGLQVNCKDDELDAKLHNNRAAANFYLGNYHESLNDAKAATDLQPTYVEAIERGASACVELHLYEEAITWCDKGLAIDKNNKTLLDIKNRSADVVSKFPKGADQKKANTNFESETSEDKKLYINFIVCGEHGKIYFDRGDYKAAIHFHVRHLKIAEKLGNRAGQGHAHSYLGNAYLNLGNFKAAIRHHDCDLEIAKELSDRNGEGGAYCNLGRAYHSLGDLKRAIDYYEYSLMIYKDMGDRDKMGRMYANLGSAHQRLGDFQKAIGYHERHLKSVQEFGDRAGEANAYLNFGNLHHRQGNFKKALEYHEHALEIAKELGDRDTEGATYANLGNDYCELGQLKEAIDYHQLHLEIVQKFENKAEIGSAYYNLGNCFSRLGKKDEAIHYYQLSLKIAKEVGDKEGEACMYYNLASICEVLGSLTLAVIFCQSSVEILNNLRDRLQGKDEWKIGLRHMYQIAYSSLWRLLFEQGKVVKALSAAEQGRAQGLIDLLELKYGGIERPCIGSNPQEEEKMNATLGCLPSNTVFMALHRRDIVFWVIQKGKDVESKKHKISDTDPQRDATTFLQSLIENVHEKLGVRSGVRCEDRSLDKLRDEMQSRERSGQTASHSSEIQTSVLRTLYETVIGPIKDLIHGSEELTIVPDGPLWLVPYAALMVSTSKYLGDSFRIRLIPSLSSLKLIADCQANYHCKTGALLVGDPWMEEITNMEGKKLLEQLPCARKEVQMIGGILKTTPLTGKNATKDEVMRRLSSVALIHIAAHGAIETGEIALTPNPTRTSPRPKEEDFLLTMADVLKVKLRARLVVLSCCHSGRGEIKAEGVVGIARAFLGAGARSVLVSLWAIDDVATLEFMKSFYQHLLEGRSASEALKEAMQHMRESTVFGAVKHWAPFVLIGDDVTLELGGTE